MMHDDLLSSVERPEMLLTWLESPESTSKRNTSKPCGFMSGWSKRSGTQKRDRMDFRLFSTKRTTPKFW